MIEYLTYDDVQMLPKFSSVPSRSQCSTQTSFTRNFQIENPLVAAPMDTVCGPQMMIKLWSLGSVGILHRFLTIDEQVKHIGFVRNEIEKYIKAQENLEYHEINENYFGTLKCVSPIIAVSTGATGDWLERAQKSIAAGANVILIDVAHGHHMHVKKAITTLHQYRNYHSLEFDIIAGNVATAEGAADLELWGADAIRVGIGPGAACETRTRTGIGVPQLTAVMECAEAVNIPVIADGGIRYIGDVAKAIGAGASTVMLGSLFAGTTESPGDVYSDGSWPRPKLSKLFRGSASESQKVANGSSTKHIEGASKLIPVKGPVEGVVFPFLDGLMSSMSYLGVQTIPDMQKSAQFIRITQAGMVEASPHILRE